MVGLPQASRFASRSRVASRSVSLGGLFARDESIEAVRQFEADWRRGAAPPLERHWAELDGEPLWLLARLVKVELRARFERGERPTVAEYLERFPALQAADDRVLSLAYEEYCLLEERGEPPDSQSFCDRYEPWADSLASQLRYHRMLSRVVGPPSRPRFPEPGEWFGGAFQLRALLGAGGAGRVYLADQPELHRKVALKVTPDSGSDREPEIVGRLDHERIVPVWSVHREPSRNLRGLCMPYRPGLTLNEAMERVGPRSHPKLARTLLLAVLPASAEPGSAPPEGWVDFPAQGTYADAAAWVALGIAEALAHAHGRGVVHRDVKPANILLTAREGPQLLDFNLADVPSAAEQAAAARSGGTLPYMAPEQLEAFLEPARWADVGPSADLYALGLVLHEMLTGDRPETPDTSLSLPRAVREMLDLRSLPVPSARAMNPRVPHALEAIVARCLAFDPADRYADAAALAEDLRRFLDRRPLRHAVNPSRAERARNWATRHRRGLRAAGALGLAAGVLLVLAATGHLRNWMTRASVPEPAPTVAKIGNDRFENRQFHEAEAGYRRALELDSGNPAALHGLALIAQQVRRDRDASRRYFEAAIRESERRGVDADKRLKILTNRCIIGLEWAGAMRERAEPEAAGREYREVLDVASRARALIPEPSSVMPESFRNAKGRVLVKHIRAKALEGLSLVSQQSGDLGGCLILRKLALDLLTSSLDLMVDRPATIKSLDGLLEATLLLDPGDDEALAALVEIRAQAGRSDSTPGGAVLAERDGR